MLECVGARGYSDFELTSFGFGPNPWIMLIRGSTRSVASLLFVIASSCGGRTDAGTSRIDPMDASEPTPDGGISQSLLQRDAQVWCEKMLACNEIVNRAECEAQRQTWVWNCHSPASEVRACLDDIAQLDCLELVTVSARTCISVHKSLDGC